MFYRNMVMKMLKCKRKFDDVTLQYSIGLQSRCIICANDQLDKTQLHIEDLHMLHILPYLYTSRFL